MPNDYIGLPTDGLGKKLDAETLVVAGQTVFRERDRIAGGAADELLDVIAREPLPVDHGAVVRAITVSGNPVRNALSAASLAAGASADLDGSVIPSGKIGRLMAALVSSSAAARWVLKTRSGASEVVIGVMVTGGLWGCASFIWLPPSKHHDTLSGNGTNTNFRITVTNLDNNNPADFYGSIYADET